jgi:1,4-alpha-glucan branching enzyme
LTGATGTLYAEHHLIPVPEGTLTCDDVRADDPSERLATLRAFLAFLWAHPGKQLLGADREFVPGRGQDPAALGVQKLIRDLNTRYLATPALWQLDTHPSGFAWVTDGSYGDTPLFALLRTAGTGDPVLSVTNFSPRPQTPRLGVPAGAAAWREVLNTDDLRYTGKGTGNPGPVPTEARPAHGRPASVTPLLPPLSTLWFKPA